MKPTLLVMICVGALLSLKAHAGEQQDRIDYFRPGEAGSARSMVKKAAPKPDYIAVFDNPEQEIQYYEAYKTIRSKLILMAADRQSTPRLKFTTDTDHPLRKEFDQAVGSMAALVCPADQVGSREACLKANGEKYQALLSEVDELEPQDTTTPRDEDFKKKSFYLYQLKQARLIDTVANARIEAARQARDEAPTRTVASKPAATPKDVIDYTSPTALPTNPGL